MDTALSRRSFVTAVATGAAAAAMARIGAAQTTASATRTAQATAAKRVTLLHITDMHAQLETHTEYMPGEVPCFQDMGGYARLKTAVDRERNTAADACFMVDGGDEVQGSGPATWTEGQLVIDPLNAFAADVFLPGNWECAYGPDRFRKTMAALKSTVVCYNFHDTKTNQRLFKPAVMIDRGGVKVAFVGITDVLASKRQRPVEFEGLDTTRINGLRDFVRDFRAKEQPDLLVAVTHTGLTIARHLARTIPEFDVVLSGHTHERTESPIFEGRVIVVEPGSMASFLGRLDLTLKPGGGVASHAWKLIPIRAETCPEDPAMKRLVDAALAPHRARMREELARTQTPLLRYDVLEANADNLISDAVREAAGTDIGLSNGFRFGLPVLAGPVLDADLWNLLPEDAKLKTGWVTGKELKAYLENELELVFSIDPWKLSGGWGPRASGLVIRYEAGNGPGRRLISVQVNGREVTDEARYTIAGCEREGEPLDVVCRNKGTHDAKVLPLTAHQALRRYFVRHPLVSPRREGRAYAVDLPPVVFSQDAVLPRARPATRAGE